MSYDYDVIVIGGGIAGSALAAKLARDGSRVLVLEQTTEYRDRVRGEAMLPWGVAELRHLGLYDTLLNAGGIHTQRWVQYWDGRSREEAEAAAIPVGQLVQDAAPLNIGHPVACAALADAAAESGADIVRGVTRVTLTRDQRQVTYSVGAGTRTANAGLIVGADGRRSTVREQAHIAQERQDPPHMLTGLLVEPAVPLPDYDVLAFDADLTMKYFVQPGGLVRVYAAPRMEQQDRFRGRDGAAVLLDALRLDCLPMGDALADGRAAGPCATFPADDTWTAQPFADGVVLIGDAAGYNNPNIGQGLSLAMRDVRIVSNVVLSSEQWTAETFRPYGEERFERMRRVRFNADLLAATFNRFVGNPEAAADAFARRMSDPALLQGLLAIFAGPETAPPEAFTEEAFETVVGSRR